MDGGVERCIALLALFTTGPAANVFTGLCALAGGVDLCNVF